MVRYRLSLILASLAIAGCSGFKEFEYRWHLKDHAKDAWKTAGIVNAGPDYEDGWKAGYFDLSMGSNGQTPPVPPKKYWSIKYQNPTGQQYILDWYSGYQDGVISAEQAGEFEWHLVPSSGVASLPPTSVGEHHVYDDISPGAEYDLPEPSTAGPATSEYGHLPPDAPQQSNNTAIDGTSQPAVDLRMFSGRPAAAVSGEQIRTSQWDWQAIPAPLAQQTKYECVSPPIDQSLLAASDNPRLIDRLPLITENEMANDGVKLVVAARSFLGEPREVQPQSPVMSASLPMLEPTTTRR